MEVYKLSPILLFFKFTLEACKINLPPNETTQNKILANLFFNQSETIIIDAEDSRVPIIKNIIIGAVSLYNHSYIILNGANTPMKVSETKLRQVITKLPNYLIVTNAFNAPIFDDLQNILFSKWSPLHMILSMYDENSVCKDGVFDEVILKQSEILLNNIWHKFQIVHVTLSLPYLCFGYYITYDKKQDSGSLLYNRTVQVKEKKNYQNPTKLKNNYKQLSEGFPLNANIFYRFPTAIIDCDDIDNFLIPKPHLSNGFCGMDGIVLWNLVEHFGFNMNYVGEHFFGYVNNGSYHGSLRNVVDGQVHVSFNSRFVVPFNDNVVFLKFIDVDCLCAIVRTPEDRPVWHFPVKAFRGNVWIILFAMLISAGIFNWLTLQLMKKHALTASKIQNILYYIEDALYSGLLGFYLNKMAGACFVRGVCLLCSVVISATFQGHVSFAFTTLVRFAPVDTIADILTSDMNVFTTAGIKTLIEPPLNDIQEKLLSRNFKVRLTGTSTDSIKAYDFEPLFTDQNAATLRRQSDFVLETTKLFTDEYGEPIFTMVDECFRCYFLSYISTNGFLFEGHLKVFMERLVEAGLPKKYYEWTRHSLRLAGPSHHSSHRHRPAASVVLGDLRIVFGILIVGYLVSATVFVCEIYWSHRRRC